MCRFIVYSYLTADYSIPMDTTVTSTSGSDRLWSILCHLSWFFGFPILFPLIVFLVMRQDSPYVAYHAKEALNFHLSLLLYIICTVPLVFILIGIPVMVALGICGLILAIVATIKTSENTLYRYPMTIRFIS
ncbi:MAG TPA: DUF4870 domain-containing protein [Opitutaceae bacterium]|nr:DUF4870 domain-containing protein [Opitutaceae bacterium]